MTWAEVLAVIDDMRSLAPDGATNLKIHAAGQMGDKSDRLRLVFESGRAAGPWTVYDGETGQGDSGASIGEAVYKTIEFAQQTADRNAARCRMLRAVHDRVPRQKTAMCPSCCGSGRARHVESVCCHCGGSGKVKP